MTPELIGLISVGIVQAAMFAKVLLTDFRKASEGHVRSIETAQIVLRDELTMARTDLREMRAEQKRCEDRCNRCEADRIRLEGRIEKLERR